MSPGPAVNTSTATVCVMIEPVNPAVAAAAWGNSTPAVLPARPVPTLPTASPKLLTGVVGPGGGPAPRAAGSGCSFRAARPASAA